MIILAYQHDKGVTVPKFGEWDENNPASAEGYTHIFNTVREERQGVVRPGQDAHADSSYPGAARRTTGSGSKVYILICCNDDFA